MERDETKLVDNPHQTEVSRCFVSHANDGRDIAIKIKSELEMLGLTVFVAHYDISPSADWPEAIIKNLRSTDIFIPVITEGFRKSDWTDQECGVALILEKYIFPIAIDKNIPYGFLNKFQAYRLKQDDYDISGLGILRDLIVAKPELSKPLLDTIISSFKTSSSFNATRDKFSSLSLFNFDLTKEQVNKIFEASLTNNQIHGYVYFGRCISPLFKKYKTSLDPELLEKLRKFFPNLFNDQLSRF